MVSVVSCSSYQQGRVSAAMEESLENLGFARDGFSGMRVAVKPNLLTAAGDNSAVITHPEFFRAAVRIIRAGGGSPFLVESPAVHSLKRVIKKTGYSRVVEEENVEAADPLPDRTLHYEGARRFKYLNVSAAYFGADMILALPKFKTHAITGITGAVKNMFGAMPGMEKSKMHLRLPGHDDFADFLLDMYGAMNFGFDPPRTVLYLMDAIEAMEGEGPGHGGSPRHMGAVLAGKDGIAVDCVAAEIAGLNIYAIPTIAKGFERGFGVSARNQIKVKGQQVESMQVDDFAGAQGGSLAATSDRWPLNTKTFKNLFVERPVPSPGLCTLCGQCVKICPSEAITMPEKSKNIPDYDYGKCIRCYCCQEICPEGAIAKKRGRLQWMLEVFERQ